RNFGPFSGFTYTVAVYSGANPANDGRFVATANGIEGVKNVVVANLTRSNIPSTAPGAIYLVNDSQTNATFNGDAFTVDGNDHKYTGGMGTAPPVTGIQTYGTPANPQITHLSNTTGVILNGNATGAGILVVEGDLTIKGDFNFVGLILVRGQTRVDTDISGNATIFGSLWTEDLNLIVGGSAIIDYSSDALALANLVGGGGALPAPVRVTSLVDCGDVPAGAAGCP